MLAILLFITPNYSATAQDDSRDPAIRDGKISIGVMNNVAIAPGHDASIDVGFRGDPLEVDGRAYPLTLVRTDPSYGSDCRGSLRHLVENDVVAVLGPVSSGCTKNVLSADVQMPIITSLATATNVAKNSAGENNPWFFRTIAHDLRRLTDYRRLTDETDYTVVLHDTSEYGLGLGRDLTTILRVPQEHIRKTHSVNVSPDESSVALDSAFVAEMRALQDEGRITFFVFGSDSPLKIIRELYKTLASFDDRDPIFVMVGASKEYLNVPPNTRVIGEPIIERNSRNIRREVENAIHDEEFGSIYTPTVDAVRVLKEAIENVLETHGRPDTLSVEAFRKEIRHALTSGKFASSEHDRDIRFLDGETNSPSAAPIYEYNLGRTLLNRPEERSRVAVKVEDDSWNWLTEPLNVRVLPMKGDAIDERAFEGRKVEIKVLNDDRVLTSRNVENLSAETTISLYPSILSTSNFFSSSDLKIEAAFNRDAYAVKVTPLGKQVVPYLLAGLCGIVAVWARNKRKQADDSDASPEFTLTMAANGFASGLLIAALVLCARPWLDASSVGWNPIPRFGSSVYGNAVISGVVGGWYGFVQIVSFLVVFIISFFKKATGSSE